MGRQVDLDDITDSTGVAEILGLAQHNSVRTVRNRNPDFPSPVLNLGKGRCLLWLRSEVKAWQASRKGRQ